MKKFIGIDLHSNNSVVVVSDEEDRMIFQKRMPNDLKLIEAALAGLMGDCLVVEWAATVSGGSWPTSAISLSFGVGPGATVESSHG